MGERSDSIEFVRIVGTFWDSLTDAELNGLTFKEVCWGCGCFPSIRDILINVNRLLRARLYSLLNSLNRPFACFSNDFVFPFFASSQSGKGDRVQTIAQHDRRVTE
jgi:hypothetical protein